MGPLNHILLQAAPTMDILVVMFCIFYINSWHKCNSYFIECNTSAHNMSKVSEYFLTHMAEIY